MSSKKILIHIQNPKIAIIIIALAVFLPYFNIFQNEFVYDDHAYFETWEGLRTFDVRAYFAGDHPIGFPHVYRPLRSVAQGAIYKITRENPFGWHVFSLLFHFASTALVYLLIKKMTNPFAALFGAIFFAVLPVHIESVTFMTASFSAFGVIFILCSLYAHIRFRETRNVKYYFLSLFLAVTAYFSYEMSLVLLLLIILYDFCFQNFTPRMLFLHSKYYIWYFLGALLYFFIRTNILQNIYTRPLFQEIEFSTRILTMTKALIRYLYLVTVNYPLSVYHPIKVSSSLDSRVAASIVILILLFGLAYYSWKREKKIYTFVIVWFFLSLLPVSNIIQISAFVYEQYLYLASFAWAFLAGYIFSLAYANGKLKETSLIVVVFGIALLYGTIVWQRNFDWKDDSLLWTKTIEQHPEFGRSYEQLGVYYKNKKDFSSAKKYLLQGIERAEDVSGLYITLGDVHGENGEYAQAVEWYKKGIGINPNRAAYYHNLGYFYMKMEKYGEAEENFRTAVDIYPVFFESTFNLAVVLLEQKKYNEAKSYFEKALELKKFNYEAVFGLGMSYLGLGEKNRAIQYFQKAIDMNPQFNPAREMLGKLQ